MPERDRVAALGRVAGGERLAGGDGGQGDREGGGGLGGVVDRATERLAELPDDGEAESGPADGSGRAPTCVGVEQRGPQCRRHACSVVDHLQPDRGSGASGTDRDLWAAVAHGVGDEVVEHLDQPRRVADRDRVRVDVEGDPDVGGERALREGVVADVGQIDPRQTDPQVAPIETVGRGEVVEQVAEQVTAARDHLGETGDHGGRQGLLDHLQGGATDHRDRVAHVVDDLSLDLLHPVRPSALSSTVAEGRGREARVDGLARPHVS